MALPDGASLMPSAATKRPWFERVDPRLVVLYLIGFIGLVITFIVGWLA